MIIKKHFFEIIFSQCYKRLHIVIRQRRNNLLLLSTRNIANFFLKQYFRIVKFVRILRCDNVAITYIINQHESNAKFKIFALQISYAYCDATMSQ